MGRHTQAFDRLTEDQKVSMALVYGRSGLLADAILELDPENVRAAIIQILWDLADATEQTPIGRAIHALGRSIADADDPNAG